MDNVLLTCAGRRNYLVDCFKKALGGKGSVIAADSWPLAPALHEADQAAVVPPITDPGYIDTIVALCAENDVRLVVSLNDLELPLLARHRGRFEAVGAVVAISTPEVVDACFDKLAMRGYLRERGFDSPRTYATYASAKRALDKGEIDFPIVVKPRWGTASLGNEYPESMEEFELVWRLGHMRLKRSALAEISSTDEKRSMLVQERLGGTEYNLDILNDLEGRHVRTFVKRKLASRVGEGAVHAVTDSCPRMEAFGRRLGEALGHVGVVDCDVFVDGDTINTVDINPRFGGSYPFIHEAGVDLPSTLVAWALGKQPDPAWLQMKPDVYSAKCDRLAVIEPGRRTLTALSLRECS